ncbi:Mariner Mos1 transposase [Eumeta japonica]|uniref:Mariner Mos1 transposase n=1 Tax=Eumeta variegata TaxID=151549 RepID=A0A4C1V355_EUMVA|nr:Mariner Mos1 transposase [Eumeta japonica]
MSFLQKVAEPNSTHDSVKKRPTDTSPEPSATNTTDMSSELPLPSTSKKPKTVDDKMSQFLDSRLQSRQNETLEFQSGVLSLIQNIKKQRESRSYSSDYGWHSQSRDHVQQSVYSSQNQNVHPPLNQNTLPSIGYGYSTRQLVEPASPTLSQHSKCLKLTLASTVADNRLLIVCVNKGDDIRLIYGSDTRQVGTSSNMTRAKGVSGHKIILHHDNTCHTSAETTRFLESQKTEVTGHPPCSPDLAPNDFYLFSSVKNKLPGQRFSSRRGRRCAQNARFGDTSSECKKCFENWLQRMRKCIDHHGGYFAKATKPYKIREYLFFLIFRTHK